MNNGSTTTNDSLLCQLLLLLQYNFQQLCKTEFIGRAVQENAVQVQTFLTFNTH